MEYYYKIAIKIWSCILLYVQWKDNSEIGFNFFKLPDQRVVTSSYDFAIKAYN